jgi:hypothetical protein
VRPCQNYRALLGPDRDGVRDGLSNLGPEAGPALDEKFALLA